MRRIYLDHASTTPLDPRVLEAMLPYFSERFGNASSVHVLGQEARAAVDEARSILARALGAQPSEVVFTSGATEANNWAILGVAWANEGRGRHIVTSAIEHHAVLEPCRFLEERGWEVTYLPVDRYGRVGPEDVRRAIRDDTVLVSVMHANNEIGTLQPIPEIARICRERGVLVHTDATQSFGAMPLQVDELGVDLLSASAHKRYGPKGVGLLYVRKGTRIAPLLRGGAQERGRRAGTENVPGIVGFGRAVEIALREREAEQARVQRLRDRLIQGLLRIESAHLNGHPTERLPNNVNVSFEGTDSETLLVNLDLAGIAASSGSACTAGSLEPSHVLRAIGLPEGLARGTVRFTLGRWTTEEEVEEALLATEEAVAQVRRVSGWGKRRPAGTRR
ncbi:MAG: cysteine desulfurase NifS [Armatimonadetes bacterium]|nr:cysteine desulfurase NifS [Armatimonadota bacterium]MDW8153819.1 cysteine desulfurase NifS [Armatimonadota bacterium]